MQILNKTHSRLINEMLQHFGISGVAESLSTREIVEALLHKVNRAGVEKLIAYLAKSDFYTAPASTRFHGNHEGGLAEHSINVLACFIRENEENELGISDESMIVSALLHDLCKVDVYVTEYKNVKEYSERGSKHDSNGNFDWVSKPGYAFEDKMPLGHGEKSMYIVMSFIPITREEAFLIRCHMGPFAFPDQYGFNNAADYQPSVVALYTADLKASTFYEVKSK